MASIESTQTGNWADGSTWVGAAVPSDDDDVTIKAGHEVTMNDDTSGFANGIAGLVIEGGATPAELIFNGADGPLKIKTACDIHGTDPSGNDNGRTAERSLDIVVSQR